MVYFSRSLQLLLRRNTSRGRPHSRRPAYHHQKRLAASVRCRAGDRTEGEEERETKECQGAEDRGVEAEGV